MRQDVYPATLHSGRHYPLSKWSYLQRLYPFKDTQTLCRSFEMMTQYILEQTAFLGNIPHPTLCKWKGANMKNFNYPIYIIPPNRDWRVAKEGEKIRHLYYHFTGINQHGGVQFWTWKSVRSPGLTQMEISGVEFVVWSSGELQYGEEPEASMQYVEKAPLAQY